jgi:hypothetical protein
MSDIVKYVLPHIADVLECDDDDALRTDVMQCAETVRTIVKSWKEPNAIAIRKAAQKAAAALDALNEVFPVYPAYPGATNDFHTVREQIELLTTRGEDGYLHGPDPRSDVLHWECAFQAYRLLKKYEREPVQARAHRLTQHLVEIVTDGAQRAPPDSKYWLLKVVRKMHRHLSPPKPPQRLARSHPKNRQRSVRA